MKKYLLTLLAPITLFATESKNDFYDSYNYFSFGVQNMQYEEHYSSTTNGEIHSTAKATSPVYMSGTLIRINDTFDFSIDLASTLLPTQVEETWTANGALAQKNQLDALLSSMQFLTHYKLNNNHRLLIGLSYKMNNFKRYSFKDSNNVNDTSRGVSEERIATLYTSTGYWYESSPHAKKDTLRFKFNALVGKRVWNEASNTEFEKVIFNNTSGYKLETSAYIGYPVLEGLEIGVFTGLSYQDKPGTNTHTDGRTRWPENTLTVWQTGLSVVWNFSKK